MEQSSQQTRIVDRFNKIESKKLENYLEKAMIKTKGTSIGVASKDMQLRKNPKIQGLVQKLELTEGQIYILYDNL